MVLRRSAAETVTRTSRYHPRDLLGPDLQILSLLRSELETLARDVAATRGPGTTRATDGDAHDGEPGAHGGYDDTAVEPWLWVQDETLRHLGPGLAAFSLGLPSLSRVSANLDGTTLRWLDQLTDETTAGEEGDSADDLDTEGSTIPEVGDATRGDVGPESAPGAGEVDEAPDHSADDLPARRARRQWCKRARDLASDLPISSRLLVLRLTLAFWSSGNWDEDDIEPVHLVADLVRSLDVLGIPRELENRVGSLAAVALTMLRDRVDHQTHNEGSLTYRKLVNDEGHLTIEADAKLIEEFVRFQQTITGFPLDSDSVQTTIAEVAGSDDLADAIDTLEAQGHEVTRPGERLLHVQGTFANPHPVALQALGMAEDSALVGVWASNDNGRWEFLAWRRPDLITIQPRTGTDTMRWRHQVLNGMIGPAALYSDRFQSEGFPYERKHKSWNQPFAVALEILDLLDIKDPRPPTC